MAAQTKVLDFLQSGLPSGQRLVLLGGDDDFLHDRVIKKLVSEIVDEDFRDFNFRRVDCQKTTPLGPLTNALSELASFFGGRLVVFLRICQLSKPVSTQLAECWKEVIAPGTVWLLTAGGGVKDSPLWNTLVKSGCLVDCNLTERDIDSVLLSHCKEKNKSVSPEALTMLRDRTGSDLRALLSHLDRCLLTLDKNEVLSAQSVEQIVPFSAEVALWKMTKAIGQRNHREALAILDQQLAIGEQPGPIFGYLNSYLTSLVQISGLMQQLRSATEVAKAIPRKTEFQIKKSLEELRTWSDKDFKDAFVALNRADFKSKGGDGGSDPKLLLQMLILKLCSRKSGRAVTIR